MTSRAAVMRLLWAAVRRLGDGGETALRAAVRRTNDRDNTNANVRDTATASAVATTPYESTRLLSDKQLYDLADEFRRRARLPAASRRPRGARGGKPRRPVGDKPVTYLASRGEVEYAEYLFELLKWSEESVRQFVERQTKSRGLTTHAAVNAVVKPLERMLRTRGYQMTERDRVKRWIAPTEDDRGEE